MNEDGIRIEFGKALHIVSELMARTNELGRDRKEAALVEQLKKDPTLMLGERIQ